MASICRRNDERWVAQYLTATGKTKYLYAGRRKDVKAKLDKALEAQADGLVEDAEKLRVGQHLSDWLAATKSTVSASSYSLRVLYARKHIASALGGVKLRELNALHIQTFYQEKLDAGMKPQTVRRMHATLSGPVRWKRVGFNVARDAERPKVTRTEIKPLSTEAISRMLDAARGDRFKCFYNHRGNARTSTRRDTRAAMGRRGPRQRDDRGKSFHT